MENCYLWLDLCWHIIRVSDLPCDVEGIDLCITAENGNAYQLMSMARAEMLPRKGLKGGAGAPQQRA